MKDPKMAAWAGSLVLHVVVLAVFGAVRFSGTNEGNSEFSAGVIRQVRPNRQEANYLPKPRVRSFSKDQLAELSKTQAERIEMEGVSKIPVMEDEYTFSAETEEIVLESLKSGVVDFFGSDVSSKVSCFVVDCSGSMRGIYERVTTRVINAIDKLQPDQYFEVILIVQGQLHELGQGRALRANSRAKTQAREFIEAARPGGRTNSLKAIEKAFRVRDDLGRGPGVVYLITDGFEMSQNGGFAGRVLEMVKRYSPGTVVNTIGLWSQAEDGEVLRSIAEQTGGKFTFVNDLEN